MGLIKIAATGAALKGLFSAIGKDAVSGAKRTKNALTPQFMRKAKILLQKNKQLRNQMANQTKSHAEEIANASKTALQGQKDQALHDKKKLRKTIIGLAAGSLGADAVMNAAWYRKTKKLKKEQNV
jgi:ribosomal protein S12 methylthiotransferase accessory factor YcaO